MDQVNALCPETVETSGSFHGPGSSPRGSGWVSDLTLGSSSTRVTLTGVCSSFMAFLAIVPRISLIFRCSE